MIKIFLITEVDAQKKCERQLSQNTPKNSQAKIEYSTSVKNCQIGSSLECQYVSHSELDDAKEEFFLNQY